MARTKQPKTYRIVVERVYWLSHDLTIEAQSAAEARRLALDEADARGDINTDTKMQDWRIVRVQRHAV